MVDKPLGGARGRKRARQQNKGDQLFQPNVGREGPTLEEARENRGRIQAQPEKVDPVTEVVDSVRARVASNSEIIETVSNNENVADRLARQRNFASPSTNQERIPGTQIANVEDAALFKEIEQDRENREETGTSTPRNTQVAGPYNEFRFKSNLLSNYENPTYHFRLSVTNSEFLKEGQYLQNLESLPRIIIAETAASQYYITDVSIDQYPNFDPGHRNQGAFQVDMTIQEPQGVSFLDDVYSASVQAGVSNWMSTPYVLELWFLGRNPQTGEVETIAGKWFYFLYLANPEMNIDEGGGKYNFTFFAFENRSLETDINLVDSEFTVTAGTVGDFLDNLTQKLNEAEKTKRQNGPIAIVNYDWRTSEPVRNQQVSKPVRSWSIVPTNFNENSQRSVSVQEVSSGTPTIHIGKGTNLGKLIENIIANTDEGIKLATGQNKILEGISEDPAYEWKYLPAIETKLNYGEYALGANDYNKEVVYTVFFRRVTGAITNPNEARKVNDPSAQRKRLIALNKTGLLNKRFDYIFTGRNTEVLNFDLKFDTLWRAPAGWYGNIYHYEAATTGPKVNEQKNAYIRGVAEKKKLLNEYAQSNRRAVDPAKNGPPQDRAALKSFYQDVKGQVEAISGGQVSVSEQEWNAVFNREDRRQVRENLEQQGRQRFRQQSQRRDNAAIRLEELDANFTDEQSRIQIASDQYDYNARVDVAHMTESDWTPGKSLFSMALHQAYGMTGRDLARIEIEVRGDPFWLGRANSDVYATSSVSLNNYSMYEQNGFIRPDYNEGNQMFLLNFGYPRDPNEDPGVNRNRFASAVYNVVRVYHKFEGGKYTQNISAFRDPLTNPDAIGSDIFKIRSQ